MVGFIAWERMTGGKLFRATGGFSGETQNLETDDQPTRFGNRPFETVSGSTDVAIGVRPPLSGAFSIRDGVEPTR